MQSRNTSTDVEKTFLLSVSVIVLWKHLHGRGEDTVDLSEATPISRNTSTDVEKTQVLL